MFEIEYSRISKNHGAASEWFQTLQTIFTEICSRNWQNQEGRAVLSSAIYQIAACLRKIANENTRVMELRVTHQQEPEILISEHTVSFRT